MASRTTQFLDPAVAEYCAAHSAPQPDPVQARLIARTAYQRLDDDRKRDLIKKEVLAARSMARKMVIRDFADLRDKIRAKRSGRAGVEVEE